MSPTSVQGPVPVQLSSLGTTAQLEFILADSCEVVCNLGGSIMTASMPGSVAVLGMLAQGLSVSG